MRALILAGLEDHWGSIDPTLNPDLDDIASAYADGVTLVARIHEVVVGTGTLLRSNEIVRMAVAREHRRHGIGKAILAELVERARSSGASRVTLETTVSWVETVAFYEAFGFGITHTEEGRFGTDVYFALDL